MAKKTAKGRAGSPLPAVGSHSDPAASVSYRKPLVKRDESRAPQSNAPEVGRVSPLRTASSPTLSGAHGVTRPTKPSALLDTRVIYCGDNLEQLQKLPDACVELARVLKKTGSFYYHCDWHASHYVKVVPDQIFGEKKFTN